MIFPEERSAAHRHAEERERGETIEKFNAGIKYSQHSQQVIRKCRNLPRLIYRRLDRVLLRFPTDREDG